MAKKKIKRKVNIRAFVILFIIIVSIALGIKAILNYNILKNIVKNSSINGAFKNIEKVEIKEFDILSGKVYLAPKGKFTIRYNIITTDHEKANINFKCEDENICSVTNDGVVTAKSVGNTKVVVSVLDEKKEVEVLVTDLIELKPAKYDPKKQLLTCGRYNNEENALLDKILAARVNEAGYHTRAGVVAAARFWLEFPYRVEYFSENGRLYTGVKGIATYIYADGEGRYYHKGLFLSKSKFNELDPKGIKYGPATWGCKIISTPSSMTKKYANGFDCSGFISWIILNGGYDPGDIGAGIIPSVRRNPEVLDLTDLGTMLKSKESVANNKIKTGDLLSTYENTGEHIALVAGQDGENYYVAESLWKGSEKGHYGAVISTYKKSDLTKFFFWHIDMDKYYGEDGNLTDMWEIER